MEVTRREALLFALDQAKQKRKDSSRGGRGLTPNEGMEDDFLRACGIVERIQEIIRAMESEPVRRAVANWQMMTENELQKPLTI